MEQSDDTPGEDKYTTVLPESYDLFLPPMAQETSAELCRG